MVSKIVECVTTIFADPSLGVEPVVLMTVATANGSPAL
jgi:hypothetical protein